jgi:flagellar hook-basal body complex protein FliE
MAIEHITTRSTVPTVRDAAEAPGKTGPGVDFSAALKDVLGSLESSNTEANKAIGRMLDGTGDVHEAMIAMQRADQMLQLTVQVRNKIVQAYQDVMRMPV